MKGYRLSEVRIGAYLGGFTNILFKEYKVICAMYCYANSKYCTIKYCLLQFKVCQIIEFFEHNSNVNVIGNLNTLSIKKSIAIYG